MVHFRSGLSALVLSSTLAAADALAFQGAPVPPPAGGAQQGQTVTAPRGQQQEGGRQRDAQGGQGGQGGQTRFAFGGGGGQGGQGGQGGRGGMMGAFSQLQTRYKPEFLRRDIPLYKEQLGFDQGQMAVIEALVNDYDFVFTPAAEASQDKIREAGMRMFQSFVGGDMRETMRTMRDTIRQDIEQMEVENGGPLTDDARRKFMSERMTKIGDDAMAARKASGADLETKKVMQEIFDEVTRWDTERATYRKAVVEGLEGALNPEQKAKWPAFQRFLRREKSMDSAILSGEGTNLFTVIDESELSQSSIDAAVKTLDAYELSLDSALVARDDYISQSEPKVMKSIIGGDTAGAKGIVDRQITLRKAVRDVNDQYRVAIMGVLPAEDSAKFNKAALASAFRRIFRETRTSEAFTKALEMADLSPEARTAISALQGSYGAELANFNERLVNLTRKEEPQQRLEESQRLLSVLDGSSSPMSMFGRGMMGGGGGGGGSGAEDPIGVVMDERGEMGTKYLEQLRGQLTPEQQEELPQGRDGGRNFGNFGTGKISELPQQFQEAAKVADKNKDGTIDESERGALFEAAGGQRGGGFGGRGGDGQGGGAAGGGSQRGGQNSTPPQRTP